MTEFDGVLNFNRKVLNVVIIPDYLKDVKEPRKLYGYLHPENGVATVVCDDTHPNVLNAGLIGELTATESKERLVGRVEGETVTFTLDGTPLTPDWYSHAQDAFSRNSGLVESKTLSKKTVVIVGTGSVGGMVAVELAKCGVGNFVLVDTDVMKIHNICRHVCNLKDVGRLKVDAVEERILSINPEAKVTKFTRQIQNVDDSLLKDHLGYDSVIIATADSRYADNQASRLAYRTDTPFVSIALWTRAATGEVFYWIPGMDMPCYECYCGQGDMQRIEPSKQYVDEINAGKVDFEPGLGLDIDFVATLGCKFVLDILSLGGDYKPRVFGYYRQYTVVSNTVEESLGQKKGLFTRPLEIRTYDYPKDPNCCTCGSAACEGRRRRCSGTSSTPTFSRTRRS